MSYKPTESPTPAPTVAPSYTFSPTPDPSFSPTPDPTPNPSFSPTPDPSFSPTSDPNSVRRRLNEGGHLSTIHDYNYVDSLSFGKISQVDVPKEIHRSKNDNYKQSVNSNSVNVDVEIHPDSYSRKLLQKRNFTEDLFISVESMGKISYQRRYRGSHPHQPNITVTFPLNLAIIHVKMGEVKVSSGF